MLADGPGELAADQHKGGHRRNLGRETSNHQVDAGLCRGFCVTSRGDGTSRSLQDKRQKIAADEEAGDELGREPRQAMSVDGDDASKAEVDGGREEGRADGQTDEVDDEGIVVEVVDVQHDAADIPDNLQSSAANDGREAAPSAILDDETDVQEEPQSEDGEV